MIAFLISILLSTYLTVVKPEAALNPSLIATVMIVVATLFVAVLAFELPLAWIPLHQAEQNVTPGILEMFRKDKVVKLINAWLGFFALFSFFLALVLSSIEWIPKYAVLGAWILLLGASLDLIYHFTQRIMRYLNPIATVDLFAKGAIESIQEEREIDLCNWIDGITEIAYKAIQRNSTMLANEALSQLQKIARLFFISSKSISHHAQDEQTKAFGITDKVSYTMFYLYQRLELVFDKALQSKLEPTCSQIITILGKIAIDGAKFDISMATPPLRSMGKLLRQAEEAGLGEVGLKGSCTLLEVAKAIINDIDITYCELQDPYLSIINTLEDLAKMEFRRDKAVSIQLLKQPFYDLKELFTTGKAAGHQDAPIILQNIDRVIGEFDALEMVMRTIPTIPPEEPAPQ